MSDSRLTLVAALAPDAPGETDATEGEWVAATAPAVAAVYAGPPAPRRLFPVPEAPAPIDRARAAKELVVLRAALRWTRTHARRYPDLQERTEALDAWRDAFRAELGLPADAPGGWMPGQADRRGPFRR